MHSLSGKFESGKFERSQARWGVSALLCAAALLAAGCHRNNTTSGAGVAWVTLSDQPGDFTSYVVNVDSITFTRSDGSVATALATAETVDFTKLKNISELWGTATIQVGLYKSASIVLDYTNANISVMVNGVPTKANVVGPTNAAVTTVTVHVNFDPATPLNVVPTYATTSAQRVSVDFDLAASTSSIDLTTPVPTVTVKPFITAGLAAPDNKLIRVRGPLVNSSVLVGTYSVYLQPFYDELNRLGTLTLFTDPSTIYTINGITSLGTVGLTQLSQSSAGTTMTAAFTTFEPTATPNATAGKFHANYVVAGSTLEDVYTQGLEGDVVARSGNTLTVRGSTLSLNNGTSSYNDLDAFVTVGPGTIVTADNNATLTGLNYNSIGVGQHIAVRGLAVRSSTNVVSVDATGVKTNSGSVRLLTTNLWGTYVSSGAGTLTLNLQTIDNWPVTAFVFAGNGATTATDSTAAAYSVSTGALVSPSTTVGDSLWIDGLVAPFGTAPPDLRATAISAEATEPASLQVAWNGAGAASPFSALTAAGMTIDLSNANFGSGVLRLGSESINLTSLTASPSIVPEVGSGAAGLPQTFTPQYAYGDPTTIAPAGVYVNSVFATFATNLTAALAATPAQRLEARGTYNRANNTFSASSINVVL